jgi:hypothetical protein
MAFQTKIVTVESREQLQLVVDNASTARRAIVMMSAEGRLLQGTTHYRDPHNWLFKPSIFIGLNSTSIRQISRHQIVLLSSSLKCIVHLFIRKQYLYQDYPTNNAH